MSKAHHSKTRHKNLSFWPMSPIGFFSRNRNTYILLTNNFPGQVAFIKGLSVAITTYTVIMYRPIKANVCELRLCPLFTGDLSLPCLFYGENGETFTWTRMHPGKMHTGMLIDCMLQGGGYWLLPRGWCMVPAPGGACVVALGGACSHGDLLQGGWYIPACNGTDSQGDSMCGCSWGGHYVGCNLGGMHGKNARGVMWFFLKRRGQ